MFSSNLYSKLSSEERSILDSYSERVAACQAKLKGTQAPQFQSFDAASPPKTVLPTYILGEEGEGPQSELREAPQREESRKGGASAKTISKSSSKRSTRHIPAKHPSRDPSPKRSSHDSSPKHATRPRSAKSLARSLNIRVIPDLEGEVEKLLKVVHHYAKQNAEMASALEGGCKLYAQYSRAMSLAGKRKKLPGKH